MADTAQSILGERTAELFIAPYAWGAGVTHLGHAEPEGFNIANLLRTPPVPCCQQRAGLSHIEPLKRHMLLE